MATEPVRSRKAAKIGAITAGAIVVGIAGTFTLASWNDSEWVSGFTDNIPGIGTSEFEVQQNADPGIAAGAWTDRESETDPNPLTFAVNPLALTPGDTIYAPVSLRTTAESIAGTVTLQPAGQSTTAVTDAALWEALELTVYTAEGTDRPACDATGLTGATWGAPIVATSTLATTAVAGASQQLLEQGTSTQHYCFVMSLPDTEANRTNDALHGTTVAPIWEFAAVSE
ncbi:hypothetical protein [Gulosibacter molinativorax]|uniref:Acyl-CoA dehydrogenase n=1 Tax=Gulosibacter molinativorax TaxID=256821 RepID=A0ABT7C882_9MICO|nr:hypothetical protein [Gulosibacter molinativorax]MDJ1370964.1 acyl-CoA dehydrogenase [Gulosibacter molinativorax]QUY62755.1 Acyl-CoA dehydrogenase [Gulosibacter molinativorax]